MNLGDMLRDTITGLTGVATSKHEYLNGCVRFTLQPKELKDGKPIEPSTFDVEQLESISVAEPRVAKPTGGPQSEPARPSVPSR